MVISMYGKQRVQHAMQIGGTPKAQPTTRVWSLRRLESSTMILRLSHRLHHSLFYSLRKKELHDVNMCKIHLIYIMFHLITHVGGKANVCVCVH